MEELIDQIIYSVDYLESSDETIFVLDFKPNEKSRANTNNFQHFKKRSQIKIVFGKSVGDC